VAIPLRNYRFDPDMVIGEGAHNTDIHAFAHYNYLNQMRLAWSHRLRTSPVYGNMLEVVRVSEVDRLSGYGR